MLSNKVLPKEHKRKENYCFVDRVEIWLSIEFQKLKRKPIMFDIENRSFVQASCYVLYELPSNYDVVADDRYTRKIF